MPGLAVTSNALSGITATGVTADTGYALASLTDDVVAKAFRNDTAAVSHEVVLDRTASFTTLEWVGAFDLVGATGGASAVSAVEVYDSPDNVSYTLRGQFYVNSRGDGGGLIRCPQRYVKYKPLLASSQKFDCGLLFASASFMLFRKQFTRRQTNKDRGVVVNDTEGGGTYTGRLRSYRHVISLDWSALDEQQHDQLVTLEDNTGGQYSGFVLVPDVTKPSELYHGRLEDTQTYTQNPGGLFEGHALAFRESGRAL